MSQKNTVFETHQETKPDLNPSSEVSFAKNRVKVKKAEIMKLNNNTTRFRLMECFATAVTFLLVIITLPFSLILCLRTAKEHEKVVIFRFGRKSNIHGPGMLFTLPCIDEVKRIDMRTKTIEVSQEVLTKDYVNITLDGVVYYKVEDPLKAVVQIDSFDQSSALLAVSTFRNAASSKLLGELLLDKNILSSPIQTLMEGTTDEWGVKVERVLINHINLPKSIRKALAVEAEANREARAKLIAAEGEKNAARSLKEASDIMSQSPGAMQLRYLQALNSFPSDHKSTIIFPIPTDLFSIFTNAQCTCSDE